MLYLLFTVYMWIMGVVQFESDVDVESMIARARCRQVSVDSNNCVIVKFLNREDAELFAKDLKRLTK
jgi:hypothetical protein